MMKVLTLMLVLLPISLLGEEVCSKMTTPPMTLIEALIKQESRGRDNAIGDSHLDEKAYGCLQVRKPCVDDVNQRYGTSYRPEQCLGNRRLSVWVCQKYIEMYAAPSLLKRQPTMEDMARIWNGGPQGWKRPCTKKYWEEVRRKL